ncbi:anti-sigma factor [Microaerobacter geothermalis]|uniref:anti-sigma factor n=1 Tax=Microaerobacter geothermalis TaxID=674972 RepID=UPI001F3D7CAE|nr:anti-sigma factor [Microaerobacter geothermalis]MCF6094634.1 anti-sigma factor [Microaerobacter geothermalis]
MTKPFCGWIEEEVVDFVLGKLSPTKQKQFKLHLESCHACAALYHEWSEILNNESIHQMQQASLNPSPSLKRRLRFHLILKKGLSFLSLHPSVSFSMIGFIVLVALVIGLFPNQNQPSGNGNILAEQNQVFQEIPMMADPRTVRYEAVPVISSDIRGYVWVNDSSNEMLLLVKGLPPLSNNDYQVWFISANKRSNVGLLNLENQIAHLYFRGGKIEQVENIAVSIEPKGGSHTPTGPDTVYINLKK